MTTPFKEISREEHELKMHSSHFLSLANSISTTLSSSLRKELDTTVTQSEQQGHGVKIPATEYLENQSKAFHTKIGYKSGESDFIAFGLTTEFIQKCAHKWIGGGGDAETREGISMVEEAFLPTLIDLCVRNLHSALDKLIPQDAFIGIMDDKELALSKETDILCYELKFSFGSYHGSISFMATAEFVASLREDQQAKENIKFKDYLNTNIVRELTVEFGQISLTTDQVKSLKKGDKLHIDHDEVCTIHAEGSKEPFGYGMLGVDAGTRQRVIKIK